MSPSMFKQIDDGLLQLLDAQVRCSIEQAISLLQMKREERGAYTHPGLKNPTHEFEQSLLRSYSDLFEQVVASLRGRNDDLAMGRLHQAEKPVTAAEELAALDYWDVPEDEQDHPVDKTRLAAILALILLWRSRHTKRATAYAATFFEQGKATALAEIGVAAVLVGELANLQETILARYTGDLDRLETALREGSPRSRGIEGIVSNAATLGEALALLRRLHETEKLRVRMFAESLAWTAWNEGFRAGAVAGTREKAKELGFVTGEGLSLAALSDEQLMQLPHYVWSGPDDEKCCEPCKKQFSDDVVAFELADLPAPQDVCRFGRACRHWWSLV
jgi:hypothetical protein